MITAKTGLAGDASENRAAQMPQDGRKHVAVTPSTQLAARATPTIVPAG